MFRKNETTRIELHKVDPESRRRSIERVKRVKENRDVGKWSKSLDELRRTAEKDDLNIFPAILNAIRSRATVGEISRVLREEWGGNTSRSPSFNLSYYKLPGRYRKSREFRLSRNRGGSSSMMLNLPLLYNSIKTSPVVSSSPSCYITIVPRFHCDTGG